MSAHTTDELELWAGPECSVVRIGDTVRDQLVLTGHDRRLDDLDAVAGLGIRTMRYPILWERTAPHSPEHYDWAWTDRQLERMRQLGIVPIAGLLHHGSGPYYTSLIDPDFPALLGQHAGYVARRYPWITHYTPVNEPLTTARFSGLYGLWYPHGRDDRTFVTALLNQCRGTVLAMAAIRAVNPAAQLVQTEDFCKTTSSPRLAYQADFDNHRRWLPFDLLCGRVTRQHALWNYLIGAGATPEDLSWFAEHPCPPDIIGANYYITSERFLDERIDLYAPHFIGENGFHRYADVEAVRVLAEGPVGLAALLREAWQRYRLPLAITETHLGSHSEERLRWIHETWHDAQRLRREGLDIRAVTLWSIFGAWDWNSLMTREGDHYETGLWDTQNDDARPTPLIRAVKSLVEKKTFSDPALNSPGWWRQPSRLLYPPYHLPTDGMAA